MDTYIWDMTEVAKAHAHIEELESKLSMIEEDIDLLRGVRQILLLELEALSWARPDDGGEEGSNAI